MAWKSSSNSPLGVPLPGNIDTEAKAGVGAIAAFSEDTLGSCQCIYLPGVASTAAGDAVVYDLLPGGQATVRLVNNAQNNSGRPVAFAIAATIAGTWGWYQIAGVAIANVAAGMAIGNVFATSTAGVVDDGADAGDQIIGARCSSAIGTPAANKSYLTLDRPHMQGQIT